MEIFYKDKTYKLNAGMGFLRDINATVQTDVIGNHKKGVGLAFHAALLKEGDMESLCLILDLLNKNAGGPRLTGKHLDEFLEDADTDIDQLVADVLDFLLKANACKKALKDLQSVLKA